ncbi:hypothetical protein Tco_0457865 [Tanacetum coccineum]
MPKLHCSPVLPVPLQNGIGHYNISELTSIVPWFSVLDRTGWYANEGEPSVIFGRDFLVTRKSKVDFGVGEMRIDLTMLEEDRDIDALLIEFVETMDEVGSSNGELVKMGKLAGTRATMKKLDEVTIGRARLSNNEFGEEDKAMIV